MSNILDIAKRVRSQQVQRRAETGPAFYTRHLSDFAAAGELRAIRLPLLDGEIIYLASDNMPLDLDEAGHYQGRVVYRAREWAKLYTWRKRSELDDAAFRLLHEAKKVFGGEIIE